MTESDRVDRGSYVLHDIGNGESFGFETDLLAIGSGSSTGVNVHGNRLGGGLSAPALTEKDIDDIKLAADIDVDYLAVSFPRSVLSVQHRQVPKLGLPELGHPGIKAIKRIKTLIIVN